MPTTRLQTKRACKSRQIFYMTKQNMFESHRTYALRITKNFKQMQNFDLDQIHHKSSLLVQFIITMYCSKVKKRLVAWMRFILKNRPSEFKLTRAIKIAEDYQSMLLWSF